MQKAKDMEVDVIFTPGANPPFALQENHGHAGQQISFKNEHHPGVVVYFTIKDADENGLEFRAEPSQALTVDNPPGGNQLVPLSVEQDHGRNVQLISYCRNWNPEKFKFSLHFMQNGAAVDYDPIGDGNNGPRF